MRKLKNIPKSPGVYKMLDDSGDTIYVGKAKDLSKRVGSYFQKTQNSARIQKMIEKIKDVQWIETGNELEALILETNLIKELRPKYNIAMRDDKNFVYIKISVNEDFPRITTTRTVSKDGAKYFGPITASHKVEKTLKILRKVLPFRTCGLNIGYQNGKAVVSRKTVKYPCLDHYIKRCLSPCIGACSPEEYKKIINQVINFLEGKPEEIIKMVKNNMMLAATDKKFELAASLRDKLTLVEEISQKQVVSDPDTADLDVINSHQEGTYIYFNLFQIRNGKLVNQENFTLKSAEVSDNSKEVLETFIKQYYEKAVSIPKEIFVPEKVDAILSKWLKTKFVIPQKGDKKHLLDLAGKNAESYARQSRVRIMQEGLDPVFDLQKVLKLIKRPVRIECYDISHLSGTNQVGSMVVFENGLAKKSDYRKFKIRKAKESDDYASLEEILKRRLDYLGEIHDGHVIKTALKKDLKFIKECKDLEQRQFYIVVKGGKICGFIREKIVSGNHLLMSLWVSEKERGKKLGQRLIRHALKKSKAKRVYIECREKLSRYCEEIGFQKIKKAPKGLEEYSRECHEACLWFAHDKKKMKDQSFDSKPDLILIDGGKGQLRAGEKVLKNFKLEIPVISIAKKEEEIFYGGKKLVLERTSEALKLVQRIRDEAHRFAIEFQKKLRATF